MTLLEHIADTSVRREMALRIGCSPDYLWQVARQWKGKRPSEMMARAIEREFDGELPWDRHVTKAAA